MIHGKIEIFLLVLLIHYMIAKNQRRKGDLYEKYTLDLRGLYWGVWFIFPSFLYFSWASLFRLWNIWIFYDGR